MAAGNGRMKPLLSVSTKVTHLKRKLIGNRLTDETSIVETPVGETNKKPKRLRIVKLPETLTGFLTSRKTQNNYYGKHNQF